MTQYTQMQNCQEEYPVGSAIVSSRALSDAGESREPAASARCCTAGSNRFFLRPGEFASQRQISTVARCQVARSGLESGEHCSMNSRLFRLLLRFSALIFL